MHALAAPRHMEVGDPAWQWVDIPGVGGSCLFSSAQETRQGSLQQGTGGGRAGVVGSRLEKEDPGDRLHVFMLSNLEEE